VGRRPSPAFAFAFAFALALALAFAFAFALALALALALSSWVILSAAKDPSSVQISQTAQRLFWRKAQPLPLLLTFETLKL
jgi:hypothetical protein